MISPTINANPTTDPMAMPAIAPPDNLFDSLATAVVEAEGDAVAEVVGTFVEKVMKAVIVGSTTLAHLLCAPDV
jgi:hypothetical protein